MWKVYCGVEAASGGVASCRCISAFSADSICFFAAASLSLLTLPSEKPFEQPTRAAAPASPTNSGRMHRERSDFAVWEMIFGIVASD